MNVFDLRYLFGSKDTLMVLEVSCACLYSIWFDSEVLLMLESRTLWGTTEVSLLIKSTRENDRTVL